MWYFILTAISICCIDPQKALFEKTAWTFKEICKSSQGEAFEKCSILFKFKEGENFNHRNTGGISRIKI